MSVTRSLTFLWTPWTAALSVAAVLVDGRLQLHRLAAVRLPRLDGAARAPAAGHRRASSPCCSTSRSGSRNSARRRSRRSPCSETPPPAWRPATWSRPTSRSSSATTRTRGGRRRMTDPAAWDRLRQRMNVVIQPFSSPAARAAVADPDREGRRTAAARTRRPRPGAAPTSTSRWPAPPSGSPTCGGSSWPPTATGTRASRRCRPPPGCGSRACPVLAVPVGSRTRLPDVELLSLDVPTFGIAGKSVRIPFTIDSSLPRDLRDDRHAQDLRRRPGHQGVRIAADGPDQRLAALEAQGRRRLHRHPDGPQAQPDEISAENNTLTAPIAIREEKLRVLLVESYPRWEYRYLRNALSRDPGVELSCLLFHPGLTKPGGGNKDYIKQFPAGLDELSKFDVVFLGDVGRRRRPVHGRAVPAAQGAGRAPGQRPGVHAGHAGAASSRCSTPSWATSARS